MTQARQLFAGDRLVATIFDPTADPAHPEPKLVVTFRHRARDPGRFDTPQPILRFTKAGWTQLHIQSRLNDWYVNDETAALCTALTPFAAGFCHVVGIGFSMGAYASLRFSGALAMTEVMAISPQYSVHPEAVPFDRRFRADAGGFDPVLGDLSRHARRSLRGVLIFDPFHPLDGRNAAMICAVTPGVQLCRFCFGGHPATGVVRETVKFGAMQDLILAGKVRRAPVLALHRANRAASPSWWRGLALQASATGRTTLASVAKSRVIA